MLLALYNKGMNLTAQTVTLPTHGALNLNANGGFTYTPTANFKILYAD